MVKSVETNGVKITGGKTSGLSSQATQLWSAGTKHAGRTALGRNRSDMFKLDVMPILLGDLYNMLGIKKADQQAQLQRLVEPIVDGSGKTDPTYGLKTKNGQLSVDSDYPPRASNAVWNLRDPLILHERN